MVRDSKAGHLDEGVDAATRESGHQLPGGETPELAAEVGEGAEVTEGRVVDAFPVRPQGRGGGAPGQQGRLLGAVTEAWIGTAFYTLLIFTKTVAWCVSPASIFLPNPSIFCFLLLLLDSSITESYCLGLTKS